MLMAQSEVAEVSEGHLDRGRSSTMPHKRNPVAAIAARASARRAPGLVATLLAGMGQEHERAAGAWHAEWETVSALLRSAGSAAAWLTECLEDLVVDTDRMRENARSASGAVHAEHLAQVLAPALGRAAAHARVAAASRESTRSGRELVDVLTDDPGLSATLDGITLDGGGGAAPALVDRALAAHRAYQEEGR
jgi:3-carboxy-cis,cis-muconate cycloisomerase